MSAVCIRYRSSDLTEAELSTLHADVVRRVERGGKFWISTTELKGHAWFRINPVNFRTRLEHMDALLDLLARECAAASVVLRSTATKDLLFGRSTADPSLRSG